MLTSDKTSKEYWANIAINSQVTLTDASALEASREAGRGYVGTEYIVKEIQHIVEKEKLCEWFIFRIVEENSELYFVAKIIGDDVQLRVYYQPEAVLVGTRKEQVDAGNLFLFRSVQNWTEYQKLQYAQQISWAFTFPGKEEETVNFNQKGNIELTGNIVLDPPIWKFLATISEYLAEKQVPEPEMMILETGSVNHPENSVVKLLIGNSINQFEISILNAKPSQKISGANK